MKDSFVIAIINAILAAFFYSLNMPLSKVLLSDVSPIMLAGLLYLGAGIGIFLLSLFIPHNKERKKLSKNDFKYTFLMVVLDIFAPISLLLGLKNTSSSVSTLIGNFEIVTTTIIACLFFKEKITKKSSVAILLITIATIILSFSGEEFRLSTSTLLVVLATLFWGLENNCTKMISGKDTFEIVFIKGLFSGLGSIIIALSTGEKFPSLSILFSALLLGFVSYGLSIFFYIKAQNKIGASRTSSFYAINPFIGSFLSFLILNESLSVRYFISLMIMALGTFFMIKDTKAQY